MAATAAALEHAPDGPVIGVGVTSMAETGVLLDRHGRSLAPAIAWHDARGKAEAARLAVDLGPERFPDRTGLPVRISSANGSPRLRGPSTAALHTMSRV